MRSSGKKKMVIYLPSQSLEEAPLLDELTPREIVRELDKYVIGQADAENGGCHSHSMVPGGFEVMS